MTNEEIIDNNSQSNDENITNSLNSIAEKLKDKYGLVFSGIAALIPVIGAVITFLIYISQSSYLGYFNVDESWTNIELSTTVFKLLSNGFCGLTALCFNVVSLYIFMFCHKESTKLKIKIVFLGILVYLLPVLSVIAVHFTGLSYIMMRIVIEIVVAFCIGLPFTLSIYFDILTFLHVVIFHPKRSFNYYVKRRKSLKLRNIFVHLSNARNRMYQVSIESVGNNMTDNVQTSRKKGYFLIASFFIFTIVILFLYAGGYGKYKAAREKCFRIVSLDEEENYSNLREDQNGENPYIIGNQRVVNSRVILTDNNDYYLVANAYYEENQNKLYIFSKEQMLIGKEDVPIVITELFNVPELR